MKQNKNEIMFLNKHNTMIKAKYNLNTSELRLYLFILYSLQRDIEKFKNPSSVNISDESVSISIPRKDFSQVITNKDSLKMSKLENVFEGLRQKPVYYEIEKKNGKKDWSVFGFILKYSYISESDTYVFLIDKLIYDMVIKYKAFGYTPLNLALMFSLNGVYAYRLYELLRLWSNAKKSINYKIDEIKEYLMLEDKKSYKVYANFKNKVISPAISELNDLELFEIEIEEVKVGKKVESINFIVKDLDDRVYIPDKFDTDKDVCKAIDNEMDKESISSAVAVTISENKEFYVPNKKLFTTKTLSDFISDFNSYDFKDSNNKKALQEAILATLEKDDEEKIKVKGYNYFKVTLEDKLKKIVSVDDNIKKVKTRFHNINQSFEKYTPEELEKLLLENQKGKFGDKKNPHKTKFHNFEETYTKYSEEELEEIIEKSQREKFR